MSKISKLCPTEVWQYFDKITKIPRPSGGEQQIIAYLKEFAAKRGLETRSDEIGNLVILKPASKGFAGSSTVVLQSHVDMVCEKDSGLDFDFKKDHIKTYIEDGWVKAKGTTLGADDGIGVAAMLAVLDSTQFTHPALECLFTIDEETGLTGAFGLGDGMLSGKYLINLDSEDEGEIFIGCAGGMGTVAEFVYQTQELPAGHSKFKIEVSGLNGGHSGDDIEKGLANSNKVLNRFLMHVSNLFEARISVIDGGNLHNAIPREAYAKFAVPTESVAAMMDYLESYIFDIQNEFTHTEKSLKITISKIGHHPAKENFDSVIEQSVQKKFLSAICGLPNGVLAMSFAMEGLVETSTNLASIKFVEGNRIVVTTSQRSSIESARNEAAAAVGAVFGLAGGAVEHSGGYPGWSPNPNSELLNITKNAYASLFGNEPKVRAIHAGLECGLFLEKYDWLEMVSFGPTLRGVHSPAERLEIASVDKFWKLLTALLGDIK